MSTNLHKEKNNQIAKVKIVIRLKYIQVQRL